MRYVEKLATPDVTVADIIGDLDPIKAARGDTSSATSDDALRMLPRANRGIFALNELPDLAGKCSEPVQLMQEGDVQIKGYRAPSARCNICFTANPEDYTAAARSSRAQGSHRQRSDQHYPRRRAGMAITNQERGPRAAPARFASPLHRRVSSALHSRREQTSDRQEIRSIAAHAYQRARNVVSNAERRAIQTGERASFPHRRHHAALPAITGKIELEYEGELVGATPSPGS